MMFRRGESEVSIRKDPAPAVAGEPLRIEIVGSKVHESSASVFPRWPPRALAFRWRHRPLASTDWLQFGFDPTHSGINPNESVLSASNVHLLAQRYHVKFTAPAQGTPVFLSNVATSQGTIDMLFVELNDGSLFALNAANGNTVWSHVPTSTPACGQAGSSPQCLITSSPAIDPNRNFVYAFSRNDGKIHKYAVATGVETKGTGNGWPELSSAKPNVEKGSSAIAFATSSTDHEHISVHDPQQLPRQRRRRLSGPHHRDKPEYRRADRVQRRVFRPGQPSISSRTAAPTIAPTCRRRTNTAIRSRPVTPASGDARQPRTIPANDSIYISTANGVYDPTNQFNYGGSFWGDSVLRLPAALSAPRTAPVDSYTPPNFDGLMRADADLGSASLAIIPTSMTQDFAYKHIGIQAGKDADVRIIDLDDNDMGTHQRSAVDICCQRKRAVHAERAADQ